MSGWQYRVISKDKSENRTESRLKKQGAGGMRAAAAAAADSSSALLCKTLPKGAARCSETHWIFAEGLSCVSDPVFFAGIVSLLKYINAFIYNI